MAPAVTTSPSVKVISATRPLVSAAICTDSSDRSEPTAVMSSLSVLADAAATSTGDALAGVAWRFFCSGAGWLWLSLPVVSDHMAVTQPACCA